MSDSNSPGSFSTKWFFIAAAATFVAGIVKVVILDRFGRGDQDDS